VVGRDDGIAEKGQPHPATWGKQWSGTKKARNPECRNGQRSIARDCEGTTRSTHVSQINYQHSGIRRGIEYRYMTGAGKAQPDERICWIWRGIRGDAKHYKHAIVFVHPLCHARRKLPDSLKGKSSIRVSIRV